MPASTTTAAHNTAIGMPNTEPAPKTVVKPTDVMGTATVAVIISAAAPTTCNIPRVTRNDGTPMKAVTKPLKAPMTTPAASATSEAKNGDQPCDIRIAAKAPVKLTMAPTDRSISPLMITSVMPTATIVMAAV